MKGIFEQTIKGGGAIQLLSSHKIAFFWTFPPSPLFKHVCRGGTPPLCESSHF